MKNLVPAAALASGALAASAHAGFTFATFSSIAAPSEQSNSAFATDYGAISADVSTTLYGTVLSGLDASDVALEMTSQMAIVGSFAGDASGMAFYTFEAPVTVLVQWSWSNLDLTGDWNVAELGSGEPVAVAGLSFNASTFTSLGDFSQTATGSGTFVLEAGSYHFSSSFSAQTMPASSSVVFTFVVPAPGAFAILGAAGLVAGGTRRRA